MIEQRESSQPLTAEALAAGETANLDSLNLQIAMQIAPRSWLSSLQRLAESTERRVPLEEAISQHAPSMSREFRSLAMASLKLPEPTQFLLDAIVARRDSQGIRWHLVLMFIYPLIMILFGAGICFLVSSVLLVLMTEGIADFGLSGYEQMQSQISDQRMALMALVSIVGWCIAVGLTLRIVGPRWAGVAVIGGLPLFGKPLRWINIAEIVQRLALTSKQVKAPIQALEAMAASFVGSSNEIVASQALARTRSGALIGSSLSRSVLSDGLCAPLLLSIDNYANQAEGCEKAAQTLRRVTDVRCKFLGMMLPLFLIITLLTIVWGTLSGYFSIMVLMMKLITSLA
jgi:type II secretory pathway component PulF